MVGTGEEQLTGEEQEETGRVKNFGVDKYSLGRNFGPFC